MLNTLRATIELAGFYEDLVGGERGADAPASSSRVGPPSHFTPIPRVGKTSAKRPGWMSAKMVFHGDHPGSRQNSHGPEQIVEGGSKTEVSIHKGQFGGRQERFA